MLDRDDFGSYRSKVIYVINSHPLEHDVVRKPLRTFRHHALGRAERAALADPPTSFIANALNCLPHPSSARLREETGHGGRSQGSGLRRTVCRPRQRFDEWRQNDRQGDYGNPKGTHGSPRKLCVFIVVNHHKYNHAGVNFRQQSVSGSIAGLRRWARRPHVEAPRRRPRQRKTPRRARHGVL